MLQQEPWTTQQMEDLFAKTQQQRGAYAEVYPFLKSLFSLKEQAVQTCRPVPLALDTQTLSTQSAAGLPLIERSAMPMDLPNAQELISALFKLAEETNPRLKQAAGRIREGLAVQAVDLYRCYRLLLSQDTEGLQRQAAILDTGNELLAFFLYHSLWPSAAVHLKEAKQHLPEKDDWAQGYCPFCGELPVLSLLGQEGRRHLVCGFCAHVWSIRRIFCPFCKNETAATLGYFFCEAEEEYRVQFCLKCRTYLKTVDLRLMTRPLYAPLEVFVTAHLDMQAEEQGFQSRTPAWFLL